MGDNDCGKLLDLELGIGLAGHFNGRPTSPPRALQLDQLPLVPVHHHDLVSSSGTPSRAKKPSNDESEMCKKNILDVNKTPPASSCSNEHHDRHKDCDAQESLVGNQEQDGIRKKHKLSIEESAIMEECYQLNHTLNNKQKEALAKQLQISTRQVEVWFQNRRARNKYKQIESDCAMWKKCYELLIDENRRLHKEIAKMKSLKPAKTTQPPAAPTTICPSCHSVITSDNTDHSCPLSKRRRCSSSKHS